MKNSSLVDASPGFFRSPRIFARIGCRWCTEVQLYIPEGTRLTPVGFGGRR